MVSSMAISSLPHNHTFLRRLVPFTPPPPPPPPQQQSSSSHSYSYSTTTTQTLRSTSFKTRSSLGTEREASPSGSDPKAGVALYKPKSYEVLVTDAANSLAFALQDGKLRLEIDFPYVLLFCNSVLKH